MMNMNIRKKNENVYDCFYISEKYIIVVLESTILKYKIKDNINEDNNKNNDNFVETVSKFYTCNNNYYDHLLKDESHFF